MHPYVKDRMLTLVLLGIVTVSPAEAQQSAAPPINRLKESIQQTINSVDAKWGVYIKSSSTGEEVAINADVEMESMSTIKIRTKP